MSSLVAYDDSDGEDDEPEEEEEMVQLPPTLKCPAVNMRQSQRNQERWGSPLHGRIPNPHYNDLGRHIGPYSGGRAVSEAHRKIPTTPCGPSFTLEPSSQPYTPPLQPQSPVGPSVAKRPQSTPAGVRPYIPKRQRLATPGDDGPKSSEENLPSDPSRVTRLLSEVSERVRPYLGPGRGGGRAEVPRRVELTIQAHEGPVNTVRWCPVPQLSHLLLSASMDKTVKVWDGAESGRCLKVYSAHAGAVRDASWSPCGRNLLTGSFDNTAVLTDVETGQQVLKVGTQFKVMCVAIQPSDPEVFLCGGYSPEVKAWDARTCKVERVYRAGIQQTLAILFLSGGREFITSSDSVSRDSAERTLIAWDYQTTARVSNQIFQERYTCPSLAAHPQEDSFVAQTNGDYMALFSSQRPYRMNKRRRFEGHKVEGYAVQCDFSQDGTLLATGSSTGSVHFYDYQSARTLHTLRAHQGACVCVSLHPLLPGVAATCDWGGEVKVWQ